MRGEQKISQSTTAELDTAFAEETRRGVRRAALARGVFFILLVTNEIINLTYREQPPMVWLRDRALLLQLGVAMAALVNFAIAIRSRRPIVWSWAFLALDLAIIGELSVAWIGPRSDMAAYPLFIVVRDQNVMLIALIPVIYFMLLSLRLQLAAGAAGLAIWLLGVWQGFAEFPGASIYTDQSDLTPAAALARFSQPTVLSLDYLAAQALLLIALTGLLAFALAAGRRHVAARVEAEARLALLERLHSPALAAKVAAAPGGRIDPARRRVAVMFIDPGLAADEGVGLARLQQAYQRIAPVVLEAGGLIDHLDGGPIMAVFGTLDEQSDAADRALACAIRLLRPAISSDLRIGLNAGDAVCGETGGGRTCAFSVVGDVVNTARRILDAASQLGARCAASQALFGPEGRGGAGWTDLGRHALRGRGEPVRLWAATP